MNSHTHRIAPEDQAPHSNSMHHIKRMIYISLGMLLVTFMVLTTRAINTTIYCISMVQIMKYHSSIKHLTLTTMHWTILSGAIGIEWLLSEQTEYTASANYYILKWLKPNNNTIYFAICAFDDFVHSASDVNVYEIADAFDSTVDGLKWISRIVYSQYYFTLLWKSMMDDSPRNHIYGITYSFTGRQETGIMKLHSDKMLNSSMLCGIHTIAARIRHDGKLFLCYEVCGVGTYSKDIVCTLLNQLTLNVDDSDAIEKRLVQNRLISQTTPLIAVYPNDNAVVCYRHNERDLNPAKRDDNIRCLMIDETLNIIVNSQQISFNDWIHNNETDGYFHMQPILYGNPYRF
eukprot:1065236_1